MAKKNRISLVKLEGISSEWFKTHLNKEVLMIDQDGEMRILFCIYSKKYDEYRIKEKDCDYEYYARLDQLFDYDKGYYDGYYDKYCQCYITEK